MARKARRWALELFGCPMDGMRDPYPALSPGELTPLRRIGGGLGKYAQLYHAYTLVALELVAFDPEGRLVATEAGY